MQVSRIGLGDAHCRGWRDTLPTPLEGLPQRAVDIRGIWNAFCSSATPSMQPRNSALFSRAITGSDGTLHFAIASVSLEAVSISSASPPA